METLKVKNVHNLATVRLLVSEFLARYILPMDHASWEHMIHQCQLLRLMGNTLSKMVQDFWLHCMTSSRFEKLKLDR